MVLLAMGATLGIWHIIQIVEPNSKTDLKVPASALLIGTGMILVMFSKKKAQQEKK